MKQTFTYKHLLKLAGSNGASFGVAPPALYFDGQRAVAACEEALMWVDCPQPDIGAPCLVSAQDVKSALAVSPSITLRVSEGCSWINGVKAEALESEAGMPAGTLDLLEFKRDEWESLVRPFRLDGSRLCQVTPAMAAKDIRYYLNGVYLDFAAGAIVACDGHRLHLIEDALPVVGLPAGTLQGAILPLTIVEILARAGGVQEMFMVGRGAERLVCIAAANAKLRVRPIAAESYVSYRAIFERTRSNDLIVMPSADNLADILAVARVAVKLPGMGEVTIEGDGKRLSFSHQDRISKTFSVSQLLKESFAIRVNGSYLIDAIRAAYRFGAALKIRMGCEEGNTIYIGAHDFHSVVMPLRADAETGQEPEATVVSASAGE